MLRKLFAAMLLAALCLFSSARPSRATGMQVYCSWHCGNDACTWTTVRAMTDCANKHHWRIHSGAADHSARLKDLR